MIKPAALLCLLLSLPPAQLFAYNTREHKAFAADAAAAVCAAVPGALCAEITDNLPFLLYGAAMEDEGYKDFKAVFNGVEFSDEEPDKHGPCKSGWLYGERHMYCNHYFFVANFLAGRPEGSCGSNLLDATTPDCDGRKPFQWESARQRGLRLWSEKVIPNYSAGSAEGRARAYYWLGRVAHLLGDMTVPAHVVPHKINYVEFEHRVFEYEAAFVETEGASPIPATADLGGLFVELARGALEVQAQVRSGECLRQPALTGCDKGRATPTRPLESRLKLKNALFTDAIMKAKPEVLSRPEILAERDLARRQLAVIKPLTVAYTARLLQLFGAQTGLSVREIALPAVDAAPSFEGRSVDFDGAPR
jgi:hypothetical protein